MALLSVCGQEGSQLTNPQMECWIWRVIELEALQDSDERLATNEDQIFTMHRSHKSDILLVNLPSASGWQQIMSS